MRDIALRALGLSAIYGLLLGSCLAALVLETEGQSFPEAHHKVVLLLGCIGICSVWGLLYQLAAVLSTTVPRR